jgi:hypothetical protein
LQPPIDDVYAKMAKTPGGLQPKRDFRKPVLIENELLMTKKRQINHVRSSSVCLIVVFSGRIYRS